MRERQIEDYLVKVVKERGGEIRKVKWIGRSAAPDRLIMDPKYGMVFVELKRPGKKPTAPQQRELDRINDFGGHATWFNCFQDIDAFFDRPTGDDFV